MMLDNFIITVLTLINIYSIFLAGVRFEEIKKYSKLKKIDLTISIIVPIICNGIILLFDRQHNDSVDDLYIYNWALYLFIVSSLFNILYRKLFNSVFLKKWRIK